MSHLKSIYDLSPLVKEIILIFCYILKIILILNVLAIYNIIFKCLLLKSHQLIIRKALEIKLGTHLVNNAFRSMSLPMAKKVALSTE